MVSIISPGIQVMKGQFYHAVKSGVTAQMRNFKMRAQNAVIAERSGQAILVTARCIGAHPDTSLARFEQGLL